MKIQEVVVAILEESGQSKSWLARQMGVTPQALSSWLANGGQGSIEKCLEILSILDYKLMVAPVSGSGTKYTLERK